MKLTSKLLTLTALGWSLATSVAVAAGAKAEPIVIVADSRRFTGWRAWWTNLYNESHLYFALGTIIIIPTVGLILGKITDFLMARLGIDLKTRKLAEH